MTTQPLTPDPGGGPAEEEPEDRRRSTRIMRYWLAPLASGRRQVMKEPRILKITGGINVLRPEGKDAPPRTLASHPEIPLWKDLSDGEQVALPYAWRTWLLPRRVLMTLVTIGALWGVLSPGFNDVAFVALWVEVVATLLAWHFSWRRAAVGLGVFAMCLTVLTGWSVGQLIAAGFVWFAAVTAWDIVNAVRYLRAAIVSWNEVVGFRRLWRPTREYRIGGASIDEVPDSSPGVLSNLFKWNIGRLKIRTNSGKEVVLKHIANWSRAMMLIDGVDEAGELGHQEALRQLELKIQYMEGRVPHDEIIPIVGAKRAAKWRAEYQSGAWRPPRAA